MASLSASLLTPILLLLLLRFASSSSFLSPPSTSTSTPSRAVYSTSTNHTGVCGFFGYSWTINGGYVTAVGRLYRNGTGCGSCYELRCTDQPLCDGGGVRVVVTDYGGSGAGVDFVLSPQAFAALAKPQFKAQIMALGVVDIVYSRISCEYPQHNLMIKVTDHSKPPGYLAVSFLYQGGKYDIVAVEVSRWCKKWIAMRHAYGNVWDLGNAPRGPLNLRFLTMAEGGAQRWVELANIFPVGWKSGEEYDTGIQLS